MVGPRLADEMLSITSELPEPVVLVGRDEALTVVEEQEERDGCWGPACKDLRERLRKARQPPPREKVYAIIGDGLVEVAEGGVEVSDASLLGMAGVPEFKGFFHTHPHSIAVPTPEDLAGAYQRRSLVECVGTRVWGRASVMCISVENPGKWGGLAREWLELARIVYEYTDYYVPVEDGEFIIFLPSPTPGRALVIENEALARSISLGAEGVVLERLLDPSL